MSTDKTTPEDPEETAENVMKKLTKCETEWGIQIEALREELNEHQSVIDEMKENWDQFIIDFAEMLNIFRNAKGFFTVVGWIAKGVRWIALFGIAIGTIIAGIKSGLWK